MTENDIKIIKNTIVMQLAGRKHRQHELLKKLLRRDLEHHECVEWIDKFKQYNL
ncbi:MAG: SOS response regulatory protein OraA/RecX [Congregibacter sp.]|jgi:SOS response regulatory protein OraA/RecX